MGGHYRVRAIVLVVLIVLVGIPFCPCGAVAGGHVSVPCVGAGHGGHDHGGESPQSPHGHGHSHGEDPGCPCECDHQEVRMVLDYKPGTPEPVWIPLATWEPPRIAELAIAAISDGSTGPGPVPTESPPGGRAVLTAHCVLNL